LQSKIFALLSTTDEPLSLEEIAERTEYSLASISTTTKMLSRFELVVTSRKPGSKRLYVQVRRNMIERIHEKIEKVQSIEIDPLKKQLPGWIKEIKKERSSAKNKELLTEQKNILEEQYKQIMKLDQVFVDIRKAFKKLDN
jgi:DNA-binding transcriptional regulator GbsR (MarR family)